MKVKEVLTGYIPRPLQAKLHVLLKRFSVLVCHRRFGKTVFSLNHMIDRGLRCELRNPQYAYIAPNYGQAKRVAWQYLKDYTRNIPGVQVNEAELRVDIPRPDKKDFVRFMLLGAENPGSLRGIYLDGGILDEYAQMAPSLWIEVIRPALSDRKGWAIFIGTPEGANHFEELFEFAQKEFASGSKDWYAAIYKASETGVIEPDELDQIEKFYKSLDQYDVYLQEYECSFVVGSRGAYFANLILKAKQENRVGSYPWDPALDVETFWDLGVNDSATIWFMQMNMGKPVFIDFHEESGLGIPELVRICLRKPYIYSGHTWPHDGRARDFSSGVPREQTARGLGLKPLRCLERSDLLDGIDACRQLINISHFDEEKCKRGLKGLSSYSKEWNEKKKCFNERPNHDWASHIADGYRTAAMGLKKTEKKKYYETPVARCDYDVFAI